MNLEYLSDMIPCSHQLNYHPDAGKSSGSHRVLVVDDEPAILFAYQRMIEKEGIRVDISTCFDGAILYINKHHYLAVIVDMRLTGTDNEEGLELLRIIQKEHPKTRTILMTGCGNSGTKEIALDLGAEHYFEKPVQPTDIIEALRSFIPGPADALIQTAS